MFSRGVLLIFAVLLLVICEGQRVYKPGDCPPPITTASCGWSCFDDSNCPSVYKCCRTACGGAKCVQPVTMRNQYNYRVKPGSCPAKPSGPWVCSSRCAYDGDCPRKNKCCKNRCGAFACTRPE